MVVRRKRSNVQMKAELNDFLPLLNTVSEKSPFYTVKNRIQQLNHKSKSLRLRNLNEEEKQNSTIQKAASPMHVCENILMYTYHLHNIDIYTYQVILHSLLMAQICF